MTVPQCDAHRTGAYWRAGFGTCRISPIPLTKPLNSEPCTSLFPLRWGHFECDPLQISQPDSLGQLLGGMDVPMCRMVEEDESIALGIKARKGAEE